MKSQDIKILFKFDKEKMRDYLTVIANRTRVGDISRKSLNNYIAKFREFVNNFRMARGIDYKTAVAEDLSPRELLLNTVEGMVANSDEYRELQKYRRQIQELNDIEKHLERLNAQLKYELLTENFQNTFEKDGT